MKTRGISIFLCILLMGILWIPSFGDEISSGDAPTGGMDRDHEINAWIQGLQDVSSDDWFYPILPGIYDLMKGVSDTEFAPNQPMTRAMFATIVYRLDGEPGEGSSAGLFADVPSGQWYSDAVNWAATFGIVKGVGDGRFDPNANVTREQMVTFLHRYTSYKGYPMSASLLPVDLFDDLDMISEFAINSMPWAIGEGLIKGVGEKHLDPKGTATRAQVAQLMYNYIMSREVWD